MTRDGIGSNTIPSSSSIVFGKSFGSWEERFDASDQARGLPSPHLEGRKSRFPPGGWWRTGHYWTIDIGDRKRTKKEKQRYVEERRGTYLSIFSGVVKFVPIFFLGEGKKRGGVLGCDHPFVSRSVLGLRPFFEHLVGIIISAMAKRGKGPHDDHRPSSEWVGAERSRAQIVRACHDSCGGWSIEFHWRIWKSFNDIS